MQELFKNKGIFLAIIQIILISIVLMIAFTTKVDQEQPIKESEIKNTSDISENLTEDDDVIEPLSDDEKIQENENEENIDSRKFNFLKTLYNYNSSDEFKENILNFFGDETYLFHFLEENSIENISSLKNKRSEIYIAKDYIYGFFDSEFIYMDIEKSGDYFTVKFPGIIKGMIYE